MLIIAERDFNDEEIQAFDIARHVDKQNLDLFSRRKVLTGISMTSAGIIMPAITKISDVAEADIAGLIKAFIQGGIEFLNEIISWGQKIVATLKLVNDSVDSVEGFVNSEIEKVNEGIRDTASSNIIVPPKKILTFQNDQFTANKDYGEGKFNFISSTDINSSSGGMRVIATESI